MKNQKGNVALIAIIVAIVAISASAITWLFFSQLRTPTQKKVATQTTSPNQETQSQTNNQEILVDSTLITNTTKKDDLSRYGEKTSEKKSDDPRVIYQAPEIGIGFLLNDDDNKSVDKWYFKLDGKNKEKYSLIINDNCLIDSVGFKDGYCLKYLNINKNVAYDGYNGPWVRIYGNILSNNLIQVSNITLVQ